MKRSQAAVLAAGAAVGLVGASVAVALSRKEGRQALQRLLARSGSVAEQARHAGERIASVAAEQYHERGPKVAEALSNVMAQAPHVVETIGSKLPKIAANGHEAPVEAHAEA